MKDRVTIYSTPLGDAMPFTTLEAAVGSNQILHETRMGSGLAIWVGAKTATGELRRLVIVAAEDLSGSDLA